MCNLVGVPRARRAFTDSRRTIGSSVFNFARASRVIVERRVRARLRGEPELADRVRRGPVSVCKIERTLLVYILLKLYTYVIALSPFARCRFYVW